MVEIHEREKIHKNDLHPASGRCAGGDGPVHADILPDNRIGAAGTPGKAGSYAKVVNSGH